MAFIVGWQLSDSQGLRMCHKFNSTVPFYSSCDEVATTFPAINITSPGAPISYTFTGSIGSPAGPLIANLSVSVVGHARVWVDDHLLLECVNPGVNPSGQPDRLPLVCNAAYDVPIPDPHFEATTSRIHVEYVAVAPMLQAFLELSYSTSPEDQPQPIPESWLSPTLSTAETAYLMQKEASESGCVAKQVFVVCCCLFSPE